MSVFVTSDTHFWHRNILKYQPNTRPCASVEEMNEAIIDRWNSVVQKDDMVYHLGDVAFCSQTDARECLDRLNGRIHLVLGNHDHVMKKPTCVGRFEWIKDYYPLKADGQLFILFHYPIFSWDRMHFGSIHLYGHTHGQIPHLYHGKSMDVGVDTNNLTPYALDDIITLFKNVEDDELIDPRGRAKR